MRLYLSRYQKRGEVRGGDGVAEQCHTFLAYGKRVIAGLATVLTRMSFGVLKVPRASQSFY